MRLKSGDSILFIGDSITDAGRNEDPECLGQGYVRMFRDLVWARYPGLALEIINQGVGGDTIRDLDRRWTADVLAHKPTWLSVSIGVNDVWRQLQTPPNPDEVFIEEFAETYRRLLTQVKDTLPCRLLLCEPTINGEAQDSAYNRLTAPYVECVARLAQEFDAIVAPMNRAFWKAICASPPSSQRQWTSDGVHPSSSGHMLVALTLFDVLDHS